MSYEDLHDAASSGNLDVVRSILATGIVKVNASDQYRWTALFFASFFGHMNVVQALLAAGANVNAASTDGETALHWASSEGHTDIVLVLLESGANPKC